MTPKANINKVLDSLPSHTEASGKLRRDSASLPASVEELQQQVEELQRQRESWKNSSDSEDRQRVLALEEENAKLKKQLQKGSDDTEHTKSASNDSDFKFELEEVKVIINLQEEMKALRELLETQSQEIRRLRGDQDDSSEGDVSSERNGEDEYDHDTGVAGMSEVVELDVANTDDSPNLWRDRYKQMRARYSQLENERALGEWSLRNRITSDSLRYNRRLLHWRNVIEEMKNEKKKLEEDHTKHTQQLRQQLQASAASVLQHTLRDLSSSQKRVKELEEQLEEAKKATPPGGSPTATGRRRMSILQYYKDRNMS